QHHSLLGGLFGHRHSSTSHQPPAQSIIPPREVSVASPTKPTYSEPASKRNSSIDTTDPSWKPLLNELIAMGITEDQIEENADLIKMYIAQRKAEEAAAEERKTRAPPPPPPPPPTGPPPSANKGPSISPQNTGSTSSSKRGPPPAPPPARRTRAE